MFVRSSLNGQKIYPLVGKKSFLFGIAKLSIFRIVMGYPLKFRVQQQIVFRPCSNSKNSMSILYKFLGCLEIGTHHNVVL